MITEIYIPEFVYYDEVKNKIYIETTLFKVNYSWVFLGIL